MMEIQPQGHPVSVFEAVGGDPAGVEFFTRLVDHFYAGVEDDRRLRHMYPEDLTDSKRWLAGFLTQYFGGPTDYSQERGHPRLRMRHAPFVIGAVERDAWLEHMMDAVDELAPSPEVRQAMAGYFEMAAQHMINAPT